MTPSDSQHSLPVMRLVDESRSKTWSRTFRVSRIVPKNSSEIPQWNMIQNSTNSRVLHDNWEKNTWTTGLQISNNGECFPAIRVVLTTSFGKSLTNFIYFVATRDSGFPRVGHIFNRFTKAYFLTLLGSLDIEFLQMAKNILSGTLPIPTNPQNLGQPVQILKFRRKHMKVHKICYDLWPNRKKSGFWPWTPPIALTSQRVLQL